MLSLQRTKRLRKPQPAAFLVPLQALAAMASHEGPRCFFSISGADGAAGGREGSLGSELPAGVVCSPSLGGGGGGGGSPAAFPRLPRGGYSFALWLRVEDTRGAAEQLAQAAGPSKQALAAAGGPPAAADQAVYALLHQQPSSDARHHPHPRPAGGQQLLQGVALAVRVGWPLGTAGGGSPAAAPSLHLVAHSWAPKHSEEALPLLQPLLPGRWHHLAATHSPGGALSHPSLALYLDGRLQVLSRGSEVPARLLLFCPSAPRHLLWPSCEPPRPRTDASPAGLSCLTPSTLSLPPQPLFCCAAGHRPPALPLHPGVAEQRVPGGGGAAAPAARPGGRGAAV